MSQNNQIEFRSLYEYLGYAAGPLLGKEVATEAAKRKVGYATHQVSTPKYTGKILRYPKSFLDSYFNKSK